MLGLFGRSRPGEKNLESLTVPLKREMLTRVSSDSPGGRPCDCFYLMLNGRTHIGG